MPKGKQSRLPAASQNAADRPGSQQLPRALPRLDTTQPAPFQRTTTVFIGKHPPNPTGRFHFNLKDSPGSAQPKLRLDHPWAALAEAGSSRGAAAKPLGDGGSGGTVMVQHPLPGPELSQRPLV